MYHEGDRRCLELAWGWIVALTVAWRMYGRIWREHRGVCLALAVAWDCKRFLIWGKHPLQAAAVPLPSPEMEQHLLTVYNSLMGGCKVGDGLFSQVTTQRKEHRVMPGLDIRKYFFTGQVVTGCPGQQCSPHS